MLDVIIPATSGRESNLRLTLEGLANQTFKNFHTTVVYDGNDLSAVQSLQNEYDFFLSVLVKKDSWNASAPRNQGVSVTVQPFILFLDSDVVLNPLAIQSYIDMIVINHDRVIIGRYDWLPPMHVSAEDVRDRFDQFKNAELLKKSTNESLGHIGEDMRKQSFEKQKDLIQTWDTIFDGLACFGGNLLVTREIFEKVGGFDENMRYGVEDGDFGLTLHEHGVVFSYNETAIGYHNWHKLSAERSQQAGLEVKKLNAKHFPDENTMNISYATGIAFARWGHEWYPPNWDELTDDEKHEFREKVKQHAKD